MDSKNDQKQYREMDNKESLYGIFKTSFSGLNAQDVSMVADSFKSMEIHMIRVSAQINKWTMSAKALRSIRFLSKHRKSPIQRIKNKNRQKPKK